MISRSTPPNASDLKDGVVELVLGLVRAQASLPTGPLTALAGLLGLRDGVAVPPLPFHELTTSGVRALASWLESVVRDAASRAAWFGQLANLLGGVASGDRVGFAIGPAQQLVSAAAVTGADGHTRLTPSLSVELAANADAIVRADADLCTIDLGGGSAIASATRAATRARPPRRRRHGAHRRGGAAERPRRIAARRTRARRGAQTRVRARRRRRHDRHARTRDAGSVDARRDRRHGRRDPRQRRRRNPRSAWAERRCRADFARLSSPAGHPEVPTIEVAAFFRDPLGAVPDVAVRRARSRRRHSVDHHDVPRSHCRCGRRGRRGVRHGHDSRSLARGGAGPVDLLTWTDGATLSIGPKSTLAVDTLGQRCTLVEAARAWPRSRLISPRRASFCLKSRRASRCARGRTDATFDTALFALLPTASPSRSDGRRRLASRRVQRADLTIDFDGPLPVPLPSIDENGNVVFSATDWDKVRRSSARWPTRPAPDGWAISPRHSAGASACA